MNDYYQILEISPNALQDEIKNQYRFLVQAWHPDKFSSPESKAKAEEKLKQINEAFSVLKDIIKRDQYDRQRQYSQKGYNYQAQGEAKEKAERERAERTAKEKAAQTKARGEERENPRTWSASPAPVRKTTVSVPRTSSLLLFLWMGIALLVFILSIVWLGAKILSPEHPIAFIATETTIEAPLATTEVPPAVGTPVVTEATAITEVLVATESPAYATEASALGIGSTMIGEDGATLVYVPEGEFIMGNEKVYSDEMPAHTVYLDAFWIDQTEVTNKMYAQCVAANKCDPPRNISFNTHSNYHGNSEFDNYPVIYVTWNMANAYCSWAGRRLPTEAEWEKAARGTDRRKYPWGNESPNNQLLNYEGNVDDTTEVGKYPDGRSIYGAYDMAGNVWEWVNDWYQTDYYATLGDNASNPQGPSSGKSHVLRGGSWAYNGVDDMVRSALRYTYPLDSSLEIGFRCSRSP